ncbi:MAG: sulfatase-like hydrolase/transferase [Pontiella sp.]
MIINRPSMHTFLRRFLSWGITTVTINGIDANWATYNNATGEIGLNFETNSFADGIYYATLTYELAGGATTQIVSSTSYVVGHRNILMMIVDDWAIDASPLYNTNNNVFLPNMPNLKTLADNGLLFSRAYAQPVCSPTRATMMTGRQVFQHGIGIPGEEGAFSEGETTIPEAFTPYATASVGKWHWGGGDEFYGITGGGVQAYTNWSKNSNGSSTTVTNYSTSDQVDEAVKFIATNDAASTPWFMWAAFNAPPP